LVPALSTIPNVTAGESIAVDMPPLEPRRTIERVGASVALSAARSVASFFVAVLLARGLGPQGYGELTFLLASFASVALLLDSGSSTGFFTLLSMRPRGRHFFIAYAVWTFGVQMVGTLIFLAVVPLSVISKAWQGEPRTVVILAFTAAFLTSQGWTSVLQLGEAQRKTFRVQIASAAQTLAHLGLVAFVVMTNRLSVTTVIVLLVLEYTVLVTVIAPPLVKTSVKSAPVDEPWRDVVREFVAYCRPVAFYGYVGFVYGFADRWLLERYGGAVQQGLFGFAQQFGAISILATGAMVNVFWKEIAEANSLGNLARLRELYIRSRRMLFFTAAWTSCLLIPWSSGLLLLAAGSKYTAGAPVLMLMLLYPVHQTLGQLQGIFLVATGRTRLYSTLGMISMSASVVVTYFLLATPSAALPGLGLGAIGLAAKLVGLQLIQVIVVSVIISRRYNWPTDLVHQFLLLAGLIVVSVTIRSLIKAAFPAWQSVAQILAALVMYGGVTGFAVWKYPALAGFSRELAVETMRRLTDRIRRRT
jgi:O-antigen/teichoic acid export membrane protein